MSKFNYTNIRNIAISLINKFGREITKNVITNTGTEWNPIPTTVSSTINAVFTNYALNEVDGTLILATDKKLLCYDALSLSDTITDDSITYNIMRVDPINPGDTKIIYKAQLRR